MIRCDAKDCARAATARWSGGRARKALASELGPNAAMLLTKAFPISSVLKGTWLTGKEWRQRWVLSTEAAGTEVADFSPFLPKRRVQSGAILSTASVLMEAQPESTRTDATHD